MKKAALLLSFLAAPLFADDLLLRNVSGTASNAGDEAPHLVSGDGPWKFFYSGSAHVTYSSETGPEVQRNETFSTNWLTAGVHRSFGDRASLLFRGRLSLEPYTIDEGYPQLLQYVSPEAGGIEVDRMRPHDLIGEAAAQFAVRIGGQTHFTLYAAPVGDPALGAAPFEVRSSSSDFAEAPFAYEIQESMHDSTSVVTAGVSTRWLTVEASVFHDAVTFGDHTDYDDGDIDSQSGRVTFRPTPSLALQISRGELGEELARRNVTSASLSWGSSRGALSAIYTSREREDTGVTFNSIGIEGTFRLARNTFMARVESVDRPQLFPHLIFPNPSEAEDTQHFAVGYIFDVIANDRWRTGLGVNIDYHTKTHDLPEEYGHKPQGIYAFVRVRTE